MADEQYSVGDVVNGHQWTGTNWEPVRYGVGHVEGGYRWSGTQWEPVAKGTGAAPWKATSQPWFWPLIGGVAALVAVALILLVVADATAKSPAYRQGYAVAAGVLASMAEDRSESEMSAYVAERLSERYDLAAFCLGQAQAFLTPQDQRDSADGCVQAYRDWPNN